MGDAESPPEQQHPAPCMVPQQLQGSSDGRRAESQRMTRTTRLTQQRRRLQGVLCPEPTGASPGAGLQQAGGKRQGAALPCSTHGARGAHRGPRHPSSLRQPYPHQRGHCSSVATASPRPARPRPGPSRTAELVKQPRQEELFHLAVLLSATIWGCCRIVAKSIFIKNESEAQPLRSPTGSGAGEH